MKFFIILTIWLLLCVTRLLTQEDLILREMTLDCEGAKIEHCFIMPPLEKGAFNFGAIAQVRTGKFYFGVFDQGQDKVSLKRLTIPSANIHKGITVSDGFLLVGALKSKGKWRPRVWKMDRHGNNVEPLTLGIENEIGEIVDIIYSSPYYWITGQVSRQFFIHCLDQSLQSIPLMDHSVKSFGNQSKGNAVQANLYGEVYVTGFSEEDGKRQLAVWKYSPKGYQVWYYPYPYSLEAEGHCMVLLDNNSLIVAGTTYQGAFSDDAFVLQIAPNGRVEIPIQKNSTDLNREMVHSIIELQKEVYWLGGEFIPFPGRFSSAWLKSLGPALHLIHDPLIFDEIVGQRIEQLIQLVNEDQLIVINGGNKIRLKFIDRTQNFCDLKLEEGLPFALQVSSENYHWDLSDPYLFEGKIRSKLPLSEWYVQVKKQLIGEKSIADLDLIIPNALPTIVEDQYCYEIQHPIELDWGTNRMVTKIQSSQQDVYQDTFFVQCQRNKPNLYVFSLGIDAKGLEYTANDAADFLNTFKNQEGRIFDHFYGSLLTDTKSTTASAIKDTIQQFSQDRLVQPKDLLFVFISSHGQVINNQFYLQGSDYDEDQLNTAVSFQDDILMPLDKLPCKKIIFIDACKSGKIQDAKGQNENSPLASALNRILAQPSGIIAKITSSNSEQNSFEDHKLKNGIFTYAIEQAFQSDNIEKVDVNDDDIITIGEFFRYLEQVVPGIAIQNEKPVQVPQIFPRPTDEAYQYIHDFPIFINPY